MEDDVAGEFDGPTITLNSDYASTEVVIYLAHSVGSIAEWSLHFDRSQKAITELRKAKRFTNETGLLEAVAR